MPLGRAIPGCTCLSSPPLPPEEMQQLAGVRRGLGGPLAWCGEHVGVHGVNTVGVRAQKTEGHCPQPPSSCPGLSSLV